MLHKFMGSRSGSWNPKKKYRLLNNKLLPKIGTYFRIALFLNNLFGQRLQSDSEFSDKILERMKKESILKMLWLLKQKKKAGDA